jgi:hypothetical protein
VFMGCKLLFHYPVDTGGRAAGAWSWPVTST